MSEISSIYGVNKVKGQGRRKAGDIAIERSITLFNGAGSIVAADYRNFDKTIEYYYHWITMIR